MSHRYGSRGNDSSGTGAIGAGSHAGTPGKQTLVQQTYGVIDAPPPARVWGDKPGDSGREAIGGNDTPGATRGDPGSGVTAPVARDASSISTSELTPADWRPDGVFTWAIQWNTNGTKGWIVQRVVSTYSGTYGSGAAITNESAGVTPSYYEAWSVDENGVVDSAGYIGNRDSWTRIDQGKGSKGHWSMTGTVYWTSEDPAKSGFTKGGVKDAKVLLSATHAPAKLSGVLLTRSADGNWDSTGAKPIHTGNKTP
jgi:hypothetical protein